MNIQEINVTKQEAFNILLEEIYLYLRYGEIEKAFDALDDAINENKNHYEYLVEKVKLLYMLYLKEEAYEVLDANIELLYNNIDKIDVDFISRRIYYHFYRNTELDATNNTTGNFDYLKITKEFINKYGFNEQTKEENSLPETAEPESTDINTIEDENLEEHFSSNDNFNLFGEPTIIKETLDELEVSHSDEIVEIFEPVVDEVNIFEEAFPEQSVKIDAVVDDKEITTEALSETIVEKFAPEVIDDEKFEPKIIEAAIKEQELEPETINEIIEEQKLELEIIDEASEEQELEPETIGEIVEEQKFDPEVIDEAIEEQEFESETVNEIIEDQKLDLEIIDAVIEEQEFEPEFIDEIVEDQKFDPEVIDEVIEEQEFGPETIDEIIEEQKFDPEITDETDTENEFLENQEATEILSAEDVEEVITEQTPLEEEDIIIEDNPNIDVPIYLGRVNGNDVFLESMANHSVPTKEEKPIIIIDSSQYTFVRLASLLVLGFVIGAAIVYYL